MKKISDERARVKGLQDDTYARMRTLKSDKYGKTKVWGENRCGTVGSAILMPTYQLNCSCESACRAENIFGLCVARPAFPLASNRWRRATSNL